MLTEAANLVIRSFWAAGISAAAQSVVQIIAQPQPQTSHTSWREQKWQQPLQQPVQQTYLRTQPQPVANFSKPVTRIDLEEYKLP